ncbi:MAG: cation diffusion facilitator family transporter [Tissierellia bacterium]|nr:cation diffusion facilitator family transporter [Tissierellia bacterium]
MTNYIIEKVFGKNIDYDDTNTRLKIGYFTSVLGIILNALLTLTKMTIGLFTGSISIVADAFNNLSDTSSAIITIIGLKLSSKPSDEEHPYGHGRIEYLAALIVSIFVIVVGIQLIISSVKSIISPKEILFNNSTVVILILSIFIKVFLANFNNVLGERTNSIPLKATGADAMGDVLVTSVVLVSFIVNNFISFSIDGYMGVIVSLIILQSGYSLVKETLSSLIGEAPPEEIVDEMLERITNHEHILGVHDLMIHSYGHGNTMATLDVEIPYDMDIVKIHEIIDIIEREIQEEMNIKLVIHMDPVGYHTEYEKEVLRKIKEVASKYESIKEIHDFNIVEDDGVETIVFDVDIDGKMMTDDEEIEKIHNELVKEISSIYTEYSYSVICSKVYD